MDPNLGAVFYTLDQNPTQPPQLTRRLDCLRCHIRPEPLMSGVFVRSTYTGADGAPLATAHGLFRPYLQPRPAVGGWYVSGTHVSTRFSREKLSRAQGEGEFHLAILFLRIRSARESRRHRRRKT